MEKCLFIYSSDLNVSSGGTMRTKTAKKILEKYFQVDFYYDYKKTNKIFIWFNAFFLNYLKTNFICCFKILNLIKKNKYKIVFFDDSNNGKVLKIIKRKYPKTFCIVNFHNNEIQYYYDLYKSKNFLFYSLFTASKVNQKYSKIYGDKKIFITEKDKNEVCNDYNSFVIPATLKDNFLEKNELNPSEGYFLFFGSSFYANDEAVRYIINEVAPFVDEKIVIAGNGMNKTFENCILPKNVKILGFIEDVQSLFYNARAFVCPIFTGSGMKIKLVEALMYGKTIICTDFAAIGFEKQKDVFFIANDKEEFISNIKNYNGQNFNSSARQLYLLKYDEKLNDNYYRPIFESFSDYQKGIM